MKNDRVRNIILITCLVFTPAIGFLDSPLFAQESQASRSTQTGSITGRVKNSVTGRYLNNARVSVKGTNLVALTDEFGKYHLPNVPTGAAVLEIFYTNMDVVETTVTVPAGGTLQHDVGLTSDARYGSVVQLDPFKVAENREMDAAALATNEQRFAPNIKNVIAADALGEVFGSAAGDFMKFLPGVAAEYNNAEVEAVNIRGIGGGLTVVTADGAPIVSGRNAGASRQVDMRTMALNNVSRLEVTKVPTPATPADTLGGAVNFVSKSAFERSEPELRVGLSLSGNMRELGLGKSPHGFIDEERRKVQPGFDFDYTLPVAPNFGIVVTGMQSNNYHYQDITTNLWQNSGAGTGSTTSNPYYRRFQILDFPRFTSKEQYSLKADWRVTPNSVLSVSGRWSENVFAESGGTNVLLDAGANGNPNPASGQRLDYGPDYTHGATGRGVVTLTGQLQNSIDESIFGGLQYRFDNGTWMIDTSYNYSGSVLVLGPQEGDPFYFGSVNARLIMPVRLSFTGVGGDRPATIQAFNNNGMEIDLYDIDNYRMFQAATDVRHSNLISRYAKLDLRRRIDRFSFPAEFQAGGSYRTQSQDIIRERAVYNFAGANPNPRPYLYQVFANDESFLGLRPFPGLSSAGAWTEFERDPTILTQTPAQVRATEEWSLDRSQYPKSR
jgi:iron complex outermembrane receptor protein